MGSQKKEAILQAKWAVDFVKKAKWAKNELWVSGLHGSSHFHSRESLFNSTTLYSSAAVIFGGLPGTLCYVAIQPCSLDYLIFACTLITVCKKGIFGKQNGWKREQNGWILSSIKEKQNRKKKKQILSRPKLDHSYSYVSFIHWTITKSCLYHPFGQN